MDMASAKGKNNKVRHHAAITALLVPLTLLFIVLLYYWNIGTGNWVAGAKFVIAVLALWIIGSVIVKVNAIGKEDAVGGLLIVGGRRGIGFMEYLARGREKFWDMFAQVGLVMSFGAASYFLFKGQITKKAYVIGFVLIAVMFFVVWPFIILAFNVITLPGVHISVQTVQLQLPVLNYTLLLEVVSLFAGGFAFFLMALLAVGAGSIIYSILTFAGNVVVSHTVNTTILSTQIPGAEPIIPGINIPLIAGILAFAVVLIVHEFSHGVLFTTYRKKVKRTGLIIFGVIPVGGFADAGEKAMKQLGKKQQNRVLVAGVMANYLFTFIFFIAAFLMMNYVMPTLYTNSVVISGTIPGTPAYNTLIPGSTILYWNGHAVTNITALEAAAKSDTAGSVVNIQTNNGSYNIVANSTGKVGVYITQQQVPARSGAYFSIANFLYQFAVLAFVLNLFVAIFNLLPLPIGLDGWHIFKNALPEKAMRIFMYLTIIIFIAILLPWIWYFMGI